MDELDFGQGFGLLLACMFSLYAIPKGLFILLIHYFPSNGIYSRFLKTDKPSKNFFRAFFCWAILILILKPVLHYFFYSIEPMIIGSLSSFINDTHSGLHLINLFFYQFVFWKYTYDKASKKISIDQELSFKKKILNYFLLFLILYVIGFFTKSNSDAFQMNWLLQNVIFFFTLLTFLSIRNLKIKSNH